MYNKGKKYKGKTRNVEDKKNRFKQAIDKILATQGFGALSSNKISLEAAVSKNLIYRYFGNHHKLIEQYLQEKDYWLNSNITIDCPTVESQIDQFKHLFRGQLLELSASPALRQIVLWELAEKNYNTIHLSKLRETIGQQYLELCHPKLFENTDFQALCAILTGAVYYLALRSASLGNYCGIDLRDEAGKKRICDTLNYILDRAIALQSETP